MNLRSNVVSIVVAGGLLAFTPDSEKIKAEADPSSNLKQTAFKKGEFCAMMCLMAFLIPQRPP